MKLKKDNGELFSPTYLKTIHNQLSAILNHAVNMYGLKDNVARKAGTMGKEENKEMEFWMQDEFQEFLECVADKPISYYAFEMLYWTGIREGELLALTPADFNFEKKTLRINKSYQRLEGKDVITDPKTPKSNRTIVMPDFLAVEMEDFISSLYGIRDDDRIFTISKRYLHHEMDRGAKLAGVKRIRIHGLRHSHISLLINLGFSALAIGERVGHEAVDITYHYAHLFPTVQTDMAAQLETEREALVNVRKEQSEAQKMLDDTKAETRKLQLETTDLRLKNSELRLEYYDNLDQLADKQKEIEAAQKEADKWMMIMDTAKWQTEQVQMKLEEAKRLKKELLGVVDGDDYLKEQVIELRYQNQMLREENRSLKDKLEKAYEFMKQFAGDIIDDGGKLVSESIPKLYNYLGIDLRTLLTNPQISDKIKAITEKYGDVIADELNSRMPLGIKVDKAYVRDILSDENAVEAIFTELWGIRSENAEYNGIADYLEQIVVRPACIRFLGMIIWAVVFALCSLVLHLIVRAVLVVRKLQPIKACDSILGAVAGAAAGAAVIAACCMLIVLAVRWTGGTEYMNEDIFSHTLVFGRIYDLMTELKI